MQSDPLVKVSSTSERFAKMRAQKESRNGPATQTTATTANASDDPLSQFQAQLQTAPKKAPTPASTDTATPKKLAPKAPVRMEVTAAALAQEFLAQCEKPPGSRADQRAMESIDGLVEVAERGAWAHVLSGAPMHLVALRSKVHVPSHFPFPCAALFF